MRTDINKNKDDIAAMDTAYKAADTALSGRIDKLEAIDHDAYVAADTALKNELQGKIDLKAAQTDLEALDDRVEVVEGELNTATTGLKARMTQAEADIDALEEKVGDKKVSEQISAITNPLDARIVELEKVDHDHANKAELDKFVDGDKAKLDAAVQTVTAAADSGLKATKTGTDVAIEIDDTLTWIFDCGTSAE
jgi:chromosome segregation ATPase